MLSAAQSDLERALADASREVDDVWLLQNQADPVALGSCYLALAAWLGGDPGRARQLSEQAVQRAGKLNHVLTTAQVYIARSAHEAFRNDPSGVLRSAETLIRLAQEHRMEFHAAVGKVFANWARSRLLFPYASAAVLQQSIADYVRPGSKIATPIFLGLLAERESDAQNFDSAVATVEEALVRASETGERWTDAFLHRLRGDILLKRDPANPQPAEEAFQTAIAIAQAQKARSFELQAVLALAKLYLLTDRLIDAHAVLAPALEGFSPTPEMPEIAEARALLAVLEETDEVKADAAQRRRTTQFRVAYGSALWATRRSSSPEAAQAFARAREEARGEGGAPERLAADYGLWVGNYQRGNLPAMKTHAATFLGDVGSRPDSPEASVAHRAAGLTHWFAGEYLEAREHLEQALSLSQAARDDDLAFRFGFLDSSVGAMALLAMALWPLGDIERAVSLVRDADARNAALAHAGTRAYGKGVVAMFDLMRGDLSRAAANRVELVRLAREHDLSLVLKLGMFLEGAATIESGAAADGLEQMRSELLREPNVVSYDGILKIVLAQAEARAGDVDRAIAIVNEALATVQSTGCVAFAAELNRVCGELLLQRDPADSASAQRALEAAIATARQQGTRSFELRAALSLAKLHQSAGRLAAAHAVLAPALEGFAPTPEMPQIAEAQALMERLA
jgi:predicted ATPase